MQRNGRNLWCGSCPNPQISNPDEGESCNENFYFNVDHSRYVRHAPGTGILAGCDRGVSTAAGGVSLNLGSGTREWLEDVIPDLVDFPLREFNVYELAARSGEPSQIGPDKGIYTVPTGFVRTKASPG